MFNLTRLPVHRLPKEDQEFLRNDYKYGPEYASVELFGQPYPTANQVNWVMLTL